MKIRYELKDIDKVAQKIYERLDHSCVVVKGDLGVGKTSLIKAISPYFGIDQNLNSPTFGFISEYLSDKKMVHMDLYRLKSVNEAFEIGVFEYFNSDAYCFVEWPEIISQLLPSHHIIELEHLGLHTRKLNFI